MNTKVAASGTFHLATHGKRLVARSMYMKGQAFIASAILLRQKGGYEYAVLQLLCQGIEVALKGLLLLVDYDTYKSRLRTLNHNLVAVADAALTAVELSQLQPPIRKELQMLSDLYSRHLLRYGNIHDILVNPATISSELVIRRMAAAFRLVNRTGIAR